MRIRNTGFESSDYHFIIPGTTSSRLSALFNVIFFYNFLYAWQDWIKHLFCLFNTGTGTRNPWISDTGIIIIIIFF
jgi:hypothetical protein